MPVAIPVLCRCGGKKINGKCDRCGVAKGRHDRTTTERGYDGAWKKLSKQERGDCPWCVLCLLNGIVRTELTHKLSTHHIVKIERDESLRLDRDNLLVVCADCHARLDRMHDANPSAYATLTVSLKALRDEELGRCGV